MIMIKKRRKKWISFFRSQTIATSTSSRSSMGKLTSSTDKRNSVDPSPSPGQAKATSSTSGLATYKCKTLSLIFIYIEELGVPSNFWKTRIGMRGQEHDISKGVMESWRSWSIKLRSCKAMSSIVGRQRSFCKTMVRSIVADFAEQPPQWSHSSWIFDPIGRAPIKICALCRAVIPSHSKVKVNQQQFNNH